MLSDGFPAFSFSAKSIDPVVFVNFARVAGILNSPRWTRILRGTRGSLGEEQGRAVELDRRRRDVVCDSEPAYLDREIEIGVADRRVFRPERLHRLRRF